MRLERTSALRNKGASLRGERENFTSGVGSEDSHPWSVTESQAMVTGACLVGSDLCGGHGREGQGFSLLSDGVVVVVRLDFEGAVVSPEIYGRRDARNTALIDLTLVSLFQLS